MARYFPDRGFFKQKAREGGLIPVCRELAADLDTPVSIFLKLGQPPNISLGKRGAGRKPGKIYIHGSGTLSGC